MNPPIPTIPHRSHSQGGVERQAVDIKQVSEIRHEENTQDGRGYFRQERSLEWIYWAHV